MTQPKDLMLHAYINVTVNNWSKKLKNLHGYNYI